MRTRVLVADDHHLVRAGLCALLAAQADLEIVGEAGNGLEALRLVGELQPQVAVLDLMMPGLNGLVVAERVTRDWPRVRVVILTMYTNQAYVVQAFRSGVHGYVLKDSTAADLVRAVRAASEGRRFLSPSLSEQALEAYLQRLERGRADRFDTLTVREREILQFVAEGWTNAEVAGRLSISRRTVEVHRARVLRKLGVRSTAELVRLAVQHGMVSAELKAFPPESP